MKRTEVIKRIRARARAAGVTWELDRQGHNHEVYRLGSTMVPIPRHTEIDNWTAEDIFKECEPELGERWWK